LRFRLVPRVVGLGESCRLIERQTIHFTKRVFEP
jgi:hypothetical protein